MPSPLKFPRFSQLRAPGYANGFYAVKVTDGRLNDLEDISAAVATTWPPGSADFPPATPSAYDDEFDGLSSVTWSNTPVAPASWDINSTRDHHAYLRAAGTGVEYVGKLQPIPASYPFTITTKVTGNTARAGFQRGGGIAIGPASPTGASAMLYYGSFHDSGLALRSYTNRILGTFTGGFTSAGATAQLGAHWGPHYHRVIANSATSFTYEASVDGFAWIRIETALNPGFTPGVMGIVGDEEAAAGGVDSYFDFFRVT